MTSSLSELLMLVGAAYGLAYIIGYSKIIHPLRTFLDDRGGVAGEWIVSLMICPACLGFWTGIASASYLGVANTVFGAIFFGLFLSGTNLALGLWTGLIKS